MSGYRPLFAMLAGAAVSAVSVAAHAAGPDKDWATYEADAAATHFAPLDQITPENVDQLEIAWRYELSEGAAVSNPLIIDGRMYAVGGGGAIVALDAATGAEIWATAPGMASGALRGLMFWPGGAGDGARILFTSGTSLRAVSAADGAAIEGFEVDLRENLERPVESIRRVAASTPGRVFEDLVIVGSSPGEAYGSPVGDIRAFDVRTGEPVWTFHTIPLPGEPGAETWPDDRARARHGGANAWAGMSVDEDRGVLYANTGSATYDYWGVDRPGDNLYADCLLAIDIRTGELLWHFQYVHHDLWDYESAATPTLMTIDRGGEPVDAVIVAGKTGYVYVFDRVTGQPVWPIPETPVPTDGGMEGEVISPTQPIPSWPEPFAKMTFDEGDIDPAIPEPDRSEWVARVRNARNDGIFTPPSERETVQMPGSNGGANYGSTAADPVAGRYYVYSSDEPAIIQMETATELQVAGDTPFERGRNIYQASCAVCHGPDLAGQPPAIPSLVDVEARMNPEQLSDIITGGGQRMPPFPNVVGGAYRDMLSFLSGDPDMIAAAPEMSPEDMAAAVVAQERWRTDYGYVFWKPEDRPAIAPPWSTFTGYDLNTGEKLFSTVVGHNPAYPVEGVKTGLPLSKIGPAVTAGGLIFIATNLDRKLEALDSETGELVWSADLPAAALGIPSVYAVDGRQFVVVPAAASGGIGSHEAEDAGPARNAYVAFALPQETAGEGAQ